MNITPTQSPSQIKLIPLTPAEVGALELRNAAIHEAAHTTVAQHLGYDFLVPEVYCTPNPGPADKTWIGRTAVYGQIENPQHLRLVGLAGLIAEDIDRDDTGPGVFIDALEFGVIELSATDAEWAGTYTYQDIINAFDVVRSLWWDIEDAAQYLMDGVTR